MDDLQGVLFWDFHGTLTYPDDPWSEVMHQLLLEHRPDRALSSSQFAELMDYDCYPWEHPNRDHRSLVDAEAWWRHVRASFFQTFMNCGIGIADSIRLSGMVRTRIMNPDLYRLRSEVIPTLDHLKNMGWRHILLTNNFPEIASICDALGILDLFDHVVVSARVGFEKPRLEIFEEALRNAGTGSIFYMIGDNPIADVRGAGNAGIPCIQIGDAPCPEAMLSCRHLSEIPGLLSEVR
jgi:FMN phosphatase YigB (HAD superfamily)